VKKKIIFFIDDGLIQFGIARFLQEKSDYDFFAIYDVNHITKPFFEQQKLVHFKKTWFLRDHLPEKVKMPDINYLKKFEEKYKINLWLLAYSERRFYRYNEYRRFSSDEILSISEEQCKFYENILDEVQPDFLCIGITDLHRNYLCAELCRAKGLKILMYNPTRLAKRVMISSDYDKIDNFDQNQVIFSSKPERSIEELQDYIKKSSAYEYISNAVEKKFSEEKFKLNAGDIFMRHLKFLLFICNNEYRKFYENWDHTRLRFLTKKDFVIPFILKRWYRKSFLDKNAIHKPSFSQLFVYFPLQYEPERTMLFSAPFYTNQREVIRHIAKSLPVEYQLYVKEHIMMKINPWREKSFYKEIIEMPNVKLLHPSVNPEIILKNCSMVITIAGSTALEAGFYQKPSIVFSDSSFSYLPFVNRVNNVENLPHIIRECLQKKFDYSSLNDFINLYNENSFEFDRTRLTQEIASKLHAYGGMTKEVPIPISKMDSFLQDHRKEFKKLADEYLKKIKQYEAKK